MFDMILFDRNAFDRSVSSGGIALTTSGGGQVEVRITLVTPIEFNLSGGGLFVPRVQSPQDVVPAFSGIGGMSGSALVLKRSITMSLNSQGALGISPVVYMPIIITFQGSGGISISPQTYLRQYMQGALSGMGTFVPQFVLAVSVTSNMQGSGEASPQISLQLPLVISHQGESSFMLRRLAAINANVIELIGINLLPGETVTIDTDSLDVLFGVIEDVSSVSTDSVFFELSPGENEITIDADSDGTMEVTAVWQNLWL